MHRNPRPIAVLSDLAGQVVRELMAQALASARDINGRIIDSFPVWFGATATGKWDVPTSAADKKAGKLWGAVKMASLFVDLVNAKGTPVRTQVFLLGLFDRKSDRRVMHHDLPYSGLGNDLGRVAIVVGSGEGMVQLDYAGMCNTLVHEFAHIIDPPTKRKDREGDEYWAGTREHAAKRSEHVAYIAEMAHRFDLQYRKASQVPPMAQAIDQFLQYDHTWARLQGQPESVMRRVLLALVRHAEDHGWPPRGAIIVRPDTATIPPRRIPPPMSTAPDLGPMPAPEMDWDD